jgi:hypothetical protein
MVVVVVVVVVMMMMIELNNSHCGLPQVTE